MRLLRGVGWASLLVVLALLPFIIRSTYALHLFIMSGVNVLLVLGLNLIMGFTGQISLAQAGFAGVGAYTSALLSLRLGLSFWFTLPISAALGALIAAGIAIPSLRLKGHYLIIVTVGFQIIMHQVFLNWVSLTRGAMGLTGVPRPTPLWILTFSSGCRDFFYLIVVIVLVCLFATHRLVNSRVGRAMKAIREDEDAARSLGIDVRRYKIQIFALGSAMAAIAGAFMAHYMGMVAPESFTIHYSFIILMMLVVGGLGSISGGVLGAVVFTVVPEYLRILEDYRELAYGFVVTLTVLFAPGGLASLGPRIADAYDKLSHVLPLHRRNIEHGKPVRSGG